MALWNVWCVPEYCVASETAGSLSGALDSRMPPEARTESAEPLANEKRAFPRDSTPEIGSVGASWITAKASMAAHRTGRSACTSADVALSRRSGPPSMFSARPARSFAMRSSRSVWIWTRTRSAWGKSSAAVPCRSACATSAQRYGRGCRPASAPIARSRTIAASRAAHDIHAGGTTRQWWARRIWSASQSGTCAGTPGLSGP